MPPPVSSDGVNKKLLRLRESFRAVRAITLDLLRPLTPEDALISATPETSPVKWHLAHTTWFFEKFILVKLGQSTISPSYDYLFNSYYEAVGPHLAKADRRNLSRPSLEEILTYRAAIDERILDYLYSPEPRDFENLSRTLEVGIHHEQQHQELILMDIKRNFYAHPFRPAYERQIGLKPRVSPTPQAMVKFPEGFLMAGADPNGGFAYDNESGRHRVWMNAFEMATGLVTNNDFLTFIDEGGYQRPELWLSDGWTMRLSEKWEAPLYWDLINGEWQTMTFSGMQPLEVNAPVSHISYYEAQAYAKWKGCRIPTEYEWEYAALQSRKSSADEIRLWEWTQSAYLPYPGFVPYDGELGEYNGKFMCNQFVLRGGSFATPHSHYRLTYRNFYEPGMRWQFAGFRLAKDVKC